MITLAADFVRNLHHKILGGAVCDPQKKAGQTMSGRRADRKMNTLDKITIYLFAKNVDKDE